MDESQLPPELQVPDAGSSLPPELKRPPPEGSRELLRTGQGSSASVGQPRREQHSPSRVPVAPVHWPAEPVGAAAQDLGDARGGPGAARGSGGVNGNGPDDAAGGNGQ
mmetsp:Transcript_13096/g.30713  ORF Transcript_13096/g.30713 Transcript_13096/m.30713 type:complete len:108 (+) Transcript_13096:415-738(+)